MTTHPRCLTCGVTEGSDHQSGCLRGKPTPPASPESFRDFVKRTTGGNSLSGQIELKFTEEDHGDMKKLEDAIQENNKPAQSFIAQYRQACADMAESKPIQSEGREWWINDDDANREVPPDKIKHKYVHVIERSAYDALKAERDELNEALHDAREAIGARSEDLYVDIEWLKEERDDLAAEVTRLKEQLNLIVVAWKAKQWKGAQKYWSAVGQAIANARAALRGEGE